MDISKCSSKLWKISVRIVSVHLKWGMERQGCVVLLLCFLEGKAQGGVVQVLRISFLEYNAANNLFFQGEFASAVHLWVHPKIQQAWRDAAGSKFQFGSEVDDTKKFLYLYVNTWF